MTHKLTEFEINQIIIEETKSFMEERRQLNEIAPLYVAGVGLTGLGKAAMAAMAGLGLWSGYEHVKNLTADPDVEGILRMIPEEESKVAKQKMKEYFEAYTNLVKQTTNYIFIPTSTLARAAEYVPDLGLSNLYAWATGGEDKTEGFTVNFEPGKPSKDAQARQVAFLQELNKIVEENPPIVTTELRPGLISTRVKALVKSTIEREFEIARQPTLVGSYMNLMPAKSSTQAIAQLNKLVDALEAAAIAANQATEDGKARALAKAKEETPETPTKPGEEGTQGGVEQVRAALTPKYTYTAATQESVLAGRDVVKPFDKTSRTGVVGVIQGLLQQAGFPIGKDGFFGPKTKEAVEKFQQSTGSALQEQDAAEGVVDSELLNRLIDVASQEEVEAITNGDLLPATPTTVRQDEASADNIPAPALKKKIEKLEARIKQGKVNKKAKAQARLNRMKLRLDYKMGKTALRQQRKPKKMNVTEKQLQEMIIEEIKIVLAEEVTTGPVDLSSADGVLQYLQSSGSWDSWGRTDRERLDVASLIYKTMFKLFDTPPRSHKELQRNDKILSLLADPLMFEPPAEGGFKGAVAQMYPKLRQKMPTQVVEPTQEPESTTDTPPAKKAIAASWEAYVGTDQTKKKIRDLWVALTDETLNEGLAEEGYNSSFKSWVKWYKSTVEADPSIKFLSPEQVVNKLEDMFEKGTEAIRNKIQKGAGPWDNKDPSSPKTIVSKIEESVYSRWQKLIKG